MFKLLDCCAHITCKHGNAKNSFQPEMNKVLPDVQAVFRKVRGTRDQIANICCILEKQGNSTKVSTFGSLTMLKTLTTWVTTKSGKHL